MVIVSYCLHFRFAYLYVQSYLPCVPPIDLLSSANDCRNPDMHVGDMWWEEGEGEGERRRWGLGKMMVRSKK